MLSRVVTATNRNVGDVVKIMDSLSSPMRFGMLCFRG